MKQLQDHIWHLGPYTASRLSELGPAAFYAAEDLYEELTVPVIDLKNYVWYELSDEAAT